MNAGVAVVKNGADLNIFINFAAKIVIRGRRVLAIALLCNCLDRGAPAAKGTPQGEIKK
jgi:hypothetical protein